MAPGELKLVTSWLQYCMKADISQTYIKLTNSLGKTMISHIPYAQFASKMAQVRTKSVPYRFGSAPGSIWSARGRAHIAFDRLHVGLGWPKLVPR